MKNTTTTTTSTTSPFVTLQLEVMALSGRSEIKNGK